MSYDARQLTFVDLTDDAFAAVVSVDFPLSTRFAERVGLQLRVRRSHRRIAVATDPPLRLGLTIPSSHEFPTVFDARWVSELHGDPSGI